MCESNSNMIFHYYYKRSWKLKDLGLNISLSSCFTDKKEKKKTGGKNGLKTFTLLVRTKQWGTKYCSKNNKWPLSNNLKISKLSRGYWFTALHIKQKKCKEVKLQCKLLILFSFHTSKETCAFHAFYKATSANFIKK